MHPGVRRLAALRFLTVLKAQTFLSPSGLLYGYYSVSRASARDIPSGEEGADVGPSAGGCLLLTPGSRPPKPSSRSRQLTSQQRPGTACGEGGSGRSLLSPNLHGLERMFQSLPREGRRLSGNRGEQMA